VASKRITIINANSIKSKVRNFFANAFAAPVAVGAVA